MPIATKNGSVLFNDQGKIAENCACCDVNPCTILCTDNPTSVTFTVSAPSDGGNPWTLPDDGEYQDDPFFPSNYISAGAPYILESGLPSSNLQSIPIQFNAINVTRTITFKDIYEQPAALIYDDGVVKIGRGNCQAYVTVGQASGPSLMRWYMVGEGEDAFMGNPEPAYVGYAKESRGGEARVFFSNSVSRPTVKIETGWGGMSDSAGAIVNSILRYWRLPATNEFQTSPCIDYQSLPLEEYRVPIIEQDGVPTGAVVVEKDDRYYWPVGPLGAEVYATAPDRQTRIASPVVITVGIS